MKLPSRHIFLGYMAGIVGGVTYGMNPLFAKPLMSNGVSVPTMLFFRYFIAALIMLLIMMCRHESRHVSRRQLPVMILLGVLYALSSILLFESYAYIPCGLATTMIYLYPVFSALLLIATGHYPSWQTLCSIILSIIGVSLMTFSVHGESLSLLGIILTVLSALCYASYLVIIHLSKRASAFTADAITYYGMFIGTVMFFFYHLIRGGNMLDGVMERNSIINLLGLSVFPTIIAMFTVAFSTRTIGASKTGVLGVFEPLSAILIGALIFHESLSWNIYLGIAVSVFAVLFMIAGTYFNRYKPQNV